MTSNIQVGTAMSTSMSNLLMALALSRGINAPEPRSNLWARAVDEGRRLAVEFDGLAVPVMDLPEAHDLGLVECRPLAEPDWITNGDMETERATHEYQLTPAGVARVAEIFLERAQS